jgi:dTDP-L-rhamnose 4-epimerase
MRVLVTGAAGFIGSHVVEALMLDGHEVRGLDLLDPAVHTTRPGYLPGDFELVVGDVRDPAALDRCLAGVDAVCHQAAMVGHGVAVADLPAFAGINGCGTAELLAAMARAGVDRLALASSMVVYGEGAYRCADHGPLRPPPRDVADLDAGIFDPRCPGCGAPLIGGRVAECAPVDPRNAYADSKVFQEHLSASWARATGGRVVALRYHNVYGPRMPRDTPYSGVAAILRSALERGGAPRVFEDGEQRRDFVHVHDVARANVRALEHVSSMGDDAGPGDGAVPAGGAPAGAGTVRVYNVASGDPHTVHEMAVALATAYGGPEPIITGEYRLGDVRHVVASPERAERELGFRAEVGFAAGMAEFATAPLREATFTEAPMAAGRP